jgi:hypothetical protein
VRLQLQTDIGDYNAEFVDNLSKREHYHRSPSCGIRQRPTWSLEQKGEISHCSLTTSRKEHLELSRSVLGRGGCYKILGDLAVRSQILPQGKELYCSATRCAFRIRHRQMWILHGLVKSQDCVRLEGSGPFSCTQVYHFEKSSKNNTSLIVLTRLLRRGLQKYENVAANGPATQPPRVVSSSCNRELRLKQSHLSEMPCGEAKTLCFAAGGVSR